MHDCEKMGCVRPDVCKVLGVHLYGGLWDKWLEDDVFRMGLIERLPEGERPGLLAEFPRRPPGLVRKARNFAAAVVKHVSHGMPRATQQEQARRQTICLACLPPAGFYDQATGKCTHKDCGCAMKRKASFAMERCPIGRW